MTDCLQLEGPSQVLDDNPSTSIVLTNNLDMTQLEPDSTNSIAITVTGDCMVTKLQQLKLNVTMTTVIQCNNNKELKVWRTIIGRIFQ